MDDFEGSKTSLEEITMAIGEIARQLEFKMEPKDVNKLLQFQDKTWTNEALRDEQTKWLLKWNLLQVKMLQRLLK